MITAHQPVGHPILPDKTIKRDSIPNFHPLCCAFLFMSLVLLHTEQLIYLSLFIKKVRCERPHPHYLGSLPSHWFHTDMYCFTFIFKSLFIAIIRSEHFITWSIIPEKFQTLIV
jgi:hypothetical protein